MKNSELDLYSSKKFIFRLYQKSSNFFHDQWGLVLIYLTFSKVVQELQFYEIKDKQIDNIMQQK